MKLTQKQAIEAYRSVRKLEEQDMPYRDARVLFEARKALEPQLQFQDEQERKLLDQLGCQISQNGAIMFSSEDAKAEYIRKITEIGEVEVEVDLEKKKFNPDALTMNARDIEALDLIFEIVC